MTRMPWCWAFLMILASTPTPSPEARGSEVVRAEYERSIFDRSIWASGEPTPLDQSCEDRINSEEEVDETDLDYQPPSIFLLIPPAVLRRPPVGLVVSPRLGSRTLPPRSPPTL